ncbi:putative Kinase family protein / peptidoglycan-binding LysM domain-containing protein [Tripterygium wilfordii]|uniref:Putative Kinase family protein / peptidoglycan-binding LysM domain-containing protein n=1 Tax=Tripterygium wilfordii TaxID=458696 RepID=A0A7J7DJN6_TRIWF|nr:putative Kinase family protein / peptidoglycan-binding LysM domain-containing protein [Tripterygium wilfordii]
MASRCLFPSLLLLLLPLLATAVFAATDMFPYTCSENIKTCNASLYHINTGYQKEQIASFYSVKTSQMTNIFHGEKTDYLIKVPCSCQNVSGTLAYFYNTPYLVKDGEIFANVSAQIYSGQVWRIGGEDLFIAGNTTIMHLLCGCAESRAEIVTYTVQNQDTLSSIAGLLSADISNIESINKVFTQNPQFLAVGWVLFVPKGAVGIPGQEKGYRHKGAIFIGILSVVTVLSISALVIIIIRRRRRQNYSEEDHKAVSKILSSTRKFSFPNQQMNIETMEDVTGLESERPVIYTLEEIEEATNDFDETKKIGEGGYGCVYFGVLGRKVELLGYASGDDHLYLVYEYVQNGSLDEYLHDPLLKGRQPLSWTARTQIALDAAKGIEYIHDHTKARHVHRDIKTSNILLDKGLRVKVADFGLAKLTERTNEEEVIATRLVGTPGYLPPESVLELQVTSKTDVFAFGVVLAELITGQRALTRDNREPNKMRSLIAVVNNIFQADDPESALEEVIDKNLQGSYPIDEVFKMAEISEWCISEDAVNRPEMREIVVTLSQIAMSSIEWEASLGGSSQVFSGIFNGR